PRVFPNETTQSLTGDPPPGVPVPVPSLTPPLPLDKARDFLGISPRASVPRLCLTPGHFAALGGLIAALFFVVVSVLVALSQGKGEDGPIVADVKNNDIAPSPQPQQPSAEKPSKSVSPQEAVAKNAEKTIARNGPDENQIAKSEAPPLPPRPVI